MKTITEAEYERIADRMVQNRLERSSAYRNAANADEQAAAEERITRSVEDDLSDLYTVTP